MASPRPLACKATKASADGRWPLYFQRLTESSVNQRQPEAAGFVTTSVTTTYTFYRPGSFRLGQSQSRPLCQSRKPTVNSLSSGDGS